MYVEAFFTNLLAFNKAYAMSVYLVVYQQSLGMGLIL